MTRTIFTWDLGATKCTGGIVEYDPQTSHIVCRQSHSVKLVEVHSLPELVECLEGALQVRMSDVDAVCIGAAGHYDGQQLLLEGVYPYAMPFAKVALQRHWPAYAVIHDYAPIVCATFTSYMQQPENIKRLNDCPMYTHGRRVALGIGTGLGLKDGVLFENGDFWLGKNEIGHIGITTPPATDHVWQNMHEELMHFLKVDEHLPANVPVTFEKILSGKGTARLYKFFYPNHGLLSPEEVGMEMRAGHVTEMLDAFAWYLGLFIGTVQLTFMPEGGIWITGGVTLNHLDVFDRPTFQQGVHASPAYRAQREEYPLGILCNLEHALIGSGYYAAKRLFSSQRMAI